MDSKFQAQLEEDGGDSTRRSWIETNSLWLMPAGSENQVKLYGRKNL